MRLRDNQEAYAIIGCAMKVHAALGCGFLESTYGDALEVELSKAGVPFCREDDVRVYYDGHPLKTTYRADFSCFDRRFIVELKAVRNLTGIEIAQVRHYMKATNAPYALLINFAREQLQYETFVLNDLRNVSEASDESEFEF